jgi:hypothetical protein
MANRLSLAERQDLANDPRLQNPQIKARVFAKLDPEDAQWIDAATKAERPADAAGLLKGALTSGADYVKAHPAEVGAMAGSLAAAPWTGGMSLLPAMGLSAVSGATGAGAGLGAEHAFSEHPPERSLTDILQTLATQGLLGAGGEGVGRAVGAGFRGAGNRLMDATIGAQAKIRGEFPDVNLAETFTSNSINPTTRRGASRVEALRRSSGAETNRLAREAGDRGVVIARSDVTPHLGPSARMAAEDALSGTPGGAGQIEREVDRLFDAQFPYGDISATDAPSVTRGLQRRGRAARAASNAGELPRGLDASVADNLASGVRQTANAKIGPAYTASNARTQSLIAGSKVARKMSRQPLQLPSLQSTALGGSVGGVSMLSGDPLTTIAGLATGTIPMALSMPPIGAPTAIALYKAGKIPYALLVKVIGPVAARTLGLIDDAAP